LGSAVLSDQEELMDVNSGEPWSEMDVDDLTHSLAYGADASSMLCRDEEEVRQKAKELGLTEHPGLFRLPSHGRWRVLALDPILRASRLIAQA
jgi:hypothetical protein